MASKKSWIPRASHDHEVAKLRVPRPPGKPNFAKTNTTSKPPVNDGLMQEDDDSVRKSLLQLNADNARMKKTLEDTVQDAEKSLQTMRELMDKREKMCADQLDAAAERTEELEQQLDGYEQVMVENKIDPVTGQPMEVSEEQAAKVQTVKKVTKKDVSKMREKLQELNENSDKYLIDIQNILAGIDEVQATSSRVGGGSKAVPYMGQSEMTQLIKEVEAAQAREDAQRKKEKKTKKPTAGGDDGLDEDDKDEQDESEEKDESEDDQDKEEEKEKEEESNTKKKLQSQSVPELKTKSDVFVTQKTS